MWDEQNCQNFEMAARGFESRFSRLRAQRSTHYTTMPHVMYEELINQCLNSSICLKMYYNMTWSIWLYRTSLYSIVEVPVSTSSSLFYDVHDDSPELLQPSTSTCSPCVDRVSQCCCTGVPPMIHPRHTRHVPGSHHSGR